MTFIDGELLAWRAWRLAVLFEVDDQRVGVRDGPRLLSLAAPYIWDGPAIRADALPSAADRNTRGIYAVKREALHYAPWRYTEECWMTGWVALSGRVVEHARGFRAERAVIRGLRLGVATHLALRSQAERDLLVASLEARYQAPVDHGNDEQLLADQLLKGGALLPFTVPLVCVKPPWQVM